MDEDSGFDEEPREDPGIGEVPHRAPTWDQLQQTIHWWLVARFGLNSARDKDIWLFCIGVAMDLERFAVGVLWVADGRREPFYAYRPQMTLGRAHREIERRGLLDAPTRDILKAVADLRNSVAHRHALHVTAHSPIEGQAIAEYKGYHLFIYREALDDLIRDADTAVKAMWDWIAARAPDLADETRGDVRPGAD